MFRIYQKTNIKGGNRGWKLVCIFFLHKFAIIKLLCSCDAIWKLLELAFSEETLILKAWELPGELK